MDTSSLAFILTPLAATPTHAQASCYTGRRLPSGRHRAAQAFFPSDSLRHSLAPPLTAYLRHGPSDAPRIDRVRLRPLQADGRNVLSARPPPPMPTRDESAVDLISISPSLYEHRPVTVTKRDPTHDDRPMTVIKREPTIEDATQHPVRKSSKLCLVEGCASRAKHARRCWKHGGSVKCKVPDCANRAKSKGVCWSHGGGSPCSVEDCDTIAVSNGFCWAHGGGKRCRERGCSRPAYERTRNYCVTHFEDLERAATALL